MHSILKDLGIGQLKDQWLNSDSEKLVQHNGFRCDSCRAPFVDARDVADLMRYQDSSCRNCGSSLDLDEMIVEISEKSSNFEVADDLSRCFDRVWYHATTMEDWLSEVDPRRFNIGGGFEAHVGTKRAAIERAITDFANRYHAKDFYLFEVSVDPKTRFLETVETDENQEHLMDGGFDAVRYVNRIEDAGSLSLAIRHDRLKILSRKRMSAEDCWRVLSVHNMERS